MIIMNINSSQRGDDKLVLRAKLRSFVVCQAKLAITGFFREGFRIRGGNTRQNSKVV